MFCKFVVDFNPRSHEGSDRVFSDNYSEILYFNPRSHEGSDYQGVTWDRLDLNFNPRSHEGSDGDLAGDWTPHAYFNPRSHEGSDQAGFFETYYNRKFQSTLPRGERLPSIAGD